MVLRTQGRREIRVLVVEDNPADALRVQEELGKPANGSFRTMVVGRIRDALPRLGEADLIVLDLTLPDGSGVDLLDRVKLEAPTLPVVVLSGRRDEETAFKCLQHGAQDVLVKGTVDGDALARSLLCALERQAMAAQRSEALLQARAAEENLRSILGASREGVLVLAPGGPALFVNTAARDLLGLPPGEVGNLPADLPLEGDEPAEVDIRGPGGEVRTLEVTVARTSWEGSPATLVTLHDLTPGRKAEEARRDLEDHRREVEWLGALGHLAGGIAHRLDNELTVVLGNTSLLMEGQPPSERYRELARRVEEAGWNAADLVRQLLAYAGRQMVRPAVLDLSAAVSDSRGRLTESLGEDIIQSWRLAPDLPKVRVDPRLLRQALRILVEHAKDSMAGGGELTVRTHLALPTAPGREEAAAALRAFVALSVTDTGPGLGPDARKRLFEPFYTTDVLGIGSGLGLAPVLGIALQCGGSVEVESTLGRGTTLRMLLPAVDDDAPSDIFPGSEVEAPGRPELPRGTEPILIVEDDIPFRSMIRNTLQELGYMVLCASNAGDAVRIASAWQGPLKVLVAETSGSGMKGSVLAEVIRCRQPGLHAVLMGSRDEACKGHASECLEDHFLLKPFPRSELALQVRRVLDSTLDPTPGASPVA